VKFSFKLVNICKSYQENKTASFCRSQCNLKVSWQQS